jgi:hypothetical protein
MGSFLIYLSRSKKKNKIMAIVRKQRRNNVYFVYCQERVLVTIKVTLEHLHWQPPNRRRHLRLGDTRTTSFYLGELFPHPVLFLMAPPLFLLALPLRLPPRLPPLRLLALPLARIVGIYGRC